MTIDRNQLEADRGQLRLRWIAAGLFTCQTLSAAIDDAVARAPATRHDCYSEHGHHCALSPVLMRKRSGSPGSLPPPEFRDLIICSGENISPKEIEDLLLDHPAIHEIAVVAYSDPRTGERACAVIVPEAGASLTLADITDHLQAYGIAKFKLPERLECIEAMPMTPNGKIRKDVLRAGLREMTTVA